MTMMPNIQGIQTELYKLNIYSGGFFIDTSRSDQMLGSLVCLQSQFSGGELVISQENACMDTGNSGIEDVRVYTALHTVLVRIYTVEVHMGPIVSWPSSAVCSFHFTFTRTCKYIDYRIEYRIDFRIDFRIDYRIDIVWNATKLLHSMSAG